MRRAELERSLGKLQNKHRADQTDRRSLSPGIEIDFSRPCIVLGGKNGAGKSRLLRGIAEQHDIGGVFIDLHHLAEQALISLRSRTDLDSMLEEFTAPALSREILSAVNLIVGREYTSIDWYSFEIEPSDPLVAERFKWGGEQSLVPYFVVNHKGHIYDTFDMGLGEFCTHFLFWIIEQYRQEKSITLLLDEPDAYLPPIGVSVLLHHIADVCLRNEWKMVLSTHSEEMIRIARDHGFFTLLRVDEEGITNSIDSYDNPSVGDSLLRPVGVRRLLFCEDESATNLVRAILQFKHLENLRQTSIVWGNGVGYLLTLQSALPKPPTHDIEIAYIFDGDQRSAVQLSADRQWSALFLPTELDPDSLFKGLAKHPEELSLSLGVPVDQLVEFLGTLTAEDPHDWVDAVCGRFDRTHALSSLASVWCRLNPAEVDAFMATLDGTHDSVDA